MAGSILYLGAGTDIEATNRPFQPYDTFVFVDALPLPGEVYGYDSVGQEKTFLEELETEALSHESSEAKLIVFTKGPRRFIITTPQT
jgi:hypothetical protein